VNQFDALRKRRACLLAWFVMATILFLIPIPWRFTDAQSLIVLPLNKVAHAIAHVGVLGLGAWVSRWNGMQGVPTALLLAVYGALIEALQTLTSYRNGQVMDWLFDLVGVSVGLVAYARATQGRVAS
jgi:hypothetical protein